MGYRLSNINNTEPLKPPCKKRSYNTIEDALDMIKYIKENRVVRELHAYKCNLCGFWHLTSKSG